MEATSTITYAWQITGKDPITHVSNERLDTIAVSWSSSGTKTILVTATDGRSVVTDTHTSNISQIPAQSISSMNIAVSALITITVTDESGTHLTNERVNFSTDYGTVLPSSTVTDEQGVAEVVVVADDDPGTATVTMSAGNLSKSVVVRFGEVTDIPSLYLPLVQR
jgi:hypothetical protein